MNQEEFDKIFNSIPTRRKEVLKLFLQGSRVSEIATSLCRTEGTIRSHLSHTYKEFDSANKEELITLFCKFKRNLVHPNLRNQVVRLKADEYLDIENISSNLCLIQGTECLNQQRYQEAIDLFKKAIDADPTDPIAQIFLNNAIANQQPVRLRPLKIVVVVAYSPQNDSHVDATKNVLRGVAQAQSKFNESQGKAGRLLEIIIANDFNQPQLAKELAKIFSDNEDILGIIGHHSSEGTQAALRIYEEKSIAVISPTSTSSKLKGKTFFRTIGSTKVVARKYAQYIQEHLKLDKIAIFYHENNEYSQTLKDDFEEAFQEGEGKIIKLIDMSNPLLDIKNLIKHIKTESNAALVISSIETNAVALAIATENSRLKSQRLQLLFSTSLPELTLEKGGDSLEGAVLVHPALAENSDYMKQARIRWQQQEINWRVATSYDATQAIIGAIRLSIVLTREEILKKLEGLNLPVEQTSGFGLNWDSDHSNTQRPYCIVQIRDHRFKEIPER